MINKLIKKLTDKYELTEINAGEFASLKANGMTFSVRAYEAEGLGHVSVMTAKGFFGLMKMDTLMIVPKTRDIPLYSYDRIYAMGNDTLIVELYDTMASAPDMSALDAAKKAFSYLEERDAGEHWYDSIKLAESISKKGKRAQTGDLDELALSHLDAYLALDGAEVDSIEQKTERNASYVYGLLEHGGPSTDVFKRSLGDQRTAELFCRVLFGVPQRK